MVIAYHMEAPSETEPQPVRVTLEQLAIIVGDLAVKVQELTLRVEASETAFLEATKKVAEES